MSKDVLPHFLADEEAIELGAWEYLVDGDWLPLPEEVPDWDYATDLHLRRSAVLRSMPFNAQTRLPVDVPLRWSLTWRSAELRLLAGLPPIDVVPDAPITLSVLLRGADAGGSVDLRTRVVLGCSRVATGPGEATRVGSILFEDARRLRLLGGLARFPIAIVDFAAAGLDEDASFVLDAPEDLAGPFMGDLLLLINERDTALCRSLLGGGKRGPAELALSESLEEALGTALLRLAAEHADELLRGSWESESVGDTLLQLTARIDGGLSQLRDLRASSPTEFETLVIGEARRNGLGRQIGDGT